MYFHKPQEKPRKWGSFQDVQYAVMKNCEKIYGVNPDSLVLDIPLFWGLPCLDYSGHNNDGTNHGATYTSQGLQTDGINDYIDYGNKPSCDFITNHEDFTLTLFIKRISNIANFDRYFIRQSSGGDGWQFVRHDSSVRAIFIVEKEGAQNYWSVGGASPKEIPTEWTIYTFCYDYSAHTVTIYENGENVNAIKEGHPGFGWGSTTNLWMGGRTGGSNWSNIEVASFILHKCQLTAEQVALFHDLPWGLYQPVSRPIWSIPAAGEEPSQGPGLMALMI